MLKEKSYKVGKYKVEIINDKGKEREFYKLLISPTAPKTFAITPALQSKGVGLKGLLD